MHVDTHQCHNFPLKKIGVKSGSVNGASDDNDTGYRSHHLCKAKSQDKPREFPPTPEHYSLSDEAHDNGTTDTNDGAAARKAKPQLKQYPLDYKPRRAKLKHEMMVYVPETTKPCTVCYCFDCPFMAYIRSYDPRLHLRSPIALQREHACWIGDEWSGMNLQNALATLTEFRGFYDKDEKLSKWESKEASMEQNLEEQLETYRSKLQDLKNAEDKVPDDPKEMKDGIDLDHKELTKQLEYQREKESHAARRLSSSSSDQEPGDAAPQTRKRARRAPQKCKKCGELRKGHKCKHSGSTESTKLVLV